MFAEGFSRAQTARRLGVSRATATRWYRRWTLEGDEGLALAPRGGRRARLNDLAREMIARTVSRPPREAGLPIDARSLQSIALLILRKTGVGYHARHVGRWLRRGGWMILPVGRHGSRAFRRIEFVDPEGTTHYLRAGAQTPEGIGR